MDRVTVVELFDQMINGDDIPQIGHLLKRTKVEQATTRLPGWPYSILTLLAHADFWQSTWIHRIEGQPRPKYQDDWREPSPDEYVAIRKSFLAGLNRAREIAQMWPMQHKMASDESALKLLVSLAIHDAYHIGQIKLMSRIISNPTT